MEKVPLPASGISRVTIVKWLVRIAAVPLFALGGVVEVLEVRRILQEFPHSWQLESAPWNAVWIVFGILVMRCGLRPFLRWTPAAAREVVGVWIILLAGMQGFALMYFLHRLAIPFVLGLAVLAFIANRFLLRWVRTHGFPDQPAPVAAREGGP